MKTDRGTKFNQVITKATSAMLAVPKRTAFIICTRSGSEAKRHSPLCMPTAKLTVACTINTNGNKVMQLSKNTSGTESKLYRSQYAANQAIGIQSMS